MSYNIPTIIVILFAVVACGCDSSESNEEFMRAQLNGQRWEAVPSLFAHADTALYVSGSVIRSCPGDSPCFMLTFVIDDYIRGNEVGESGSYPARTASYVVLNGDVVYGAFDALRGTPSVWITYDEASRMLSGSFEGVFVLDDYLGPELGLPDTLRFTEGEFQAHLTQ